MAVLSVVDMLPPSSEYGSNAQEVAMRQSQSITLVLFLSALFCLVLAQAVLTSSPRPAGRSIFNLSDQPQNQDFEAAELQRQANLSCGQ